jgi:mono/diheme cytochrome c family protein
MQNVGGSAFGGMREKHCSGRSLNDALPSGAMACRNLILASVITALVTGFSQVVVSAPETRSPDFARDVAPIFEQHCIQCHQPGIKKGDLSLASRADLDANDYLSPGEPDESHLLEVVTSSGGAKPQMPKGGPPLSAKELAALRDWIAAGAPWPAEIVVHERSKADRDWWSLVPVQPIEPPAADGAPSEWNHDPIDRFIAARLAASNLRPNPPADRRALIRRVTYDLTGLPPTPAEVAAFVSDPAADAYEKLVDRLLSSPRYGEQFGRRWLDVVRFGESTGYEVNHIVDNAWPYRDYVIDSFNEDKPFNRFVTEQLAGDSLAAGDPATEIGLAFLVCGPVDIVGNADAVQAAQIRADAVDEMIRAAGEAFLGLTIGCARCHDHKFDPISQRDYYAMYATFSGVFHGDRVLASEVQLREHAEKLAALEATKKQLQEQRADLDQAGGGDEKCAPIDNQLAVVEQQIAALPALPNFPVGRFEQPAGEQCIFEGGDAQRKGQRVVPASMSTLADALPEYRLADDAPEKERRLALARWIVADDNPLTARVLVNRLWQAHFGAGIVATPSDFGFMGARPTHPELLDWLASQLVDNGWRLKPLQKLIVMSQTYRQASTFRNDAAHVDADSRLLWRFPPRRLSAEEIRDTMLFVAGQLDERMGGPGFRLYNYVRDNVATYTPLDEFGPETHRRSVYHQNARATRIDLLSDFDMPDCAFSVSRRVPTTTPTQALALMNHSFTMEMAQALAARLSGSAGAANVSAQIDASFQLAFGRAPTASETAAAAALVDEFGLQAFCRALLNSSEMIYLN